MPEKEEIIIRTEEVNEILSSPPKWLFRWGISIVFCLIILFIVLSYFIKYPDVLTAKITLTTINPPISLRSKIGGKLTHLLVKNNDLLQENQVIALIENTANYNDVLYLGSMSTELLSQLKLTDSIPNIELKDSVDIGELTPFYLQCLKSFKDAALYKSINPYKRQIVLLHKDLVSYRDLLIKYRKQEGINKEQLMLVETDFNRDQLLYESKAISARECENKRKEYLNALGVEEQAKITVCNVLIQINSIEKNILQLQIEDYQEHSRLKNDLAQNLKTLESEINKWKQKYLIQSPVDGKISFFSLWAVNQNIEPGDELFSIIPNKKQEFIGKCVLPTINTGKLRVGQKVNIKLDNYSYNEWGILQGIVTNISEVPNKETYAIDVKLSNGLITSYNKALLYKEEMKGSADIFTQNISVMNRIFFNFGELVSRD